jgi:hypothetical protein
VNKITRRQFNLDDTHQIFDWCGIDEKPKYDSDYTAAPNILGAEILPIGLKI